MSQDNNLRPARIIPDLSSDLPNTPRNSYLIPFVPTTAEENGALFRGDNCFNLDLIECPLFNICSLVIKDAKVISARLNTNDLGLLSEEVKTNLTRTILDPALNEKVEKPFTISSLNEEALCTKDLDLDPFYNKPKTKVIIPPMPEEPPSTLEDIEPKSEAELSLKDFDYVAKELPGLEVEPPPINPDFGMVDDNEIHIDTNYDSNEGVDPDIGINLTEDQKIENETTNPMPEPPPKDDNDDYYFSWQKQANL